MPIELSQELQWKFLYLYIHCAVILFYVPSHEFSHHNSIRKPAWAFEPPVGSAFEHSSGNDFGTFH